jgi:hypothetical protein
VTPVRVQRRRAKGWRMPDNTIYVGRPTKWGNPFLPGRHGTAKDCVELYQLAVGGLLCVSAGRDTIAAQERLHAAVRKDLAELRGKHLACFCRLDRPCHADILIAVANDLPLTLLTVTRIN